MAIMTTGPSRRLTRADWEATPESNRKIELLDGVIIEAFPPSRDVSAARFRHQSMLGGLCDLMKSAVPPGWPVIFAPYDMFVSDTVVLQPDLIVAPRERFQEHGLEVPPVLVAEILSPSTRRRDLIRKFGWFRGFGVEHVWFADPEEPSVIAYELVEGHYAEVGQAIGEETLRIERPFPLEVTPQRLLED
jgi:Uma2 family endonuclease